jgi:hypothetical protein
MDVLFKSPYKMEFNLANDALKMCWKTQKGKCNQGQPIDIYASGSSVDRHLCSRIQILIILEHFLKIHTYHI